VEEDLNRKPIEGRAHPGKVQQSIRREVEEKAMGDVICISRMSKSQKKGGPDVIWRHRSNAKRADASTYLLIEGGWRPKSKAGVKVGGTKISGARWRGRKGLGIGGSIRVSMTRAILFKRKAGG